MQLMFVKIREQLKRTRLTSSLNLFIKGDSIVEHTFRFDNFRNSLFSTQEENV